MRPMRSPKWPKIREPIGRAKKAAAKAAMEASSLAVSSWPVKNRAGNTATAAVPYT